MKQPTTAQKILRVLSIISIVGAVLTMVLAAFFLFGGGYYSAAGEAVDGMTAAEVGGMAFFVGICALVEGIVCLVEGILGIRASGDNQKIMPVWVLSIIGLIGAVISCASNLFSGQQLSASTIGSIVGSLLGSGLMLWLANTIKKEAGK